MLTLPPLCFTSEMKHALPTSGSKSTFIFDSLSFSVLGPATWSLSLRTAGYRNWIPFTDMLGMASLMGEITAMPEVWPSLFPSLFPSLVSRGRIAAHFYSKTPSFAYELTDYLLRCVNHGGLYRKMTTGCPPLFWMLVLLGQCTRPPAKGQRYDTLLFFIMLHVCLQGIRCIPY